jgi:4-alpha-glucanotransferase
VPLGKKRVVLAIHDGCFPADPDEDTGRGSPYDRGGRRFLERIAELGFNAVQLGPQGQTSLDNASPYDGTVFSRSWLSIGLMDLVEEGLLDRAAVERIVEARPDGRAYSYAYRAKRDVLRTLSPGAHAGQLAAYREREKLWLEPDSRWEANDASDPAMIDRWPLWQLIAERQHAELRSFCAGLGLSLYGDLQVGLSPRDLWAWSDLFLSGWRMGAPPSRTNPEGQPWGYPVIDPERVEEGLRFVAARIERMGRFYDGVRIDHPHGLVCPWVYRGDVAGGARLYDAPDHPELRRYAIAREEQIDPSVAPWADGRVRWLDPDQVDRYAVLFDALVSRTELPICEVLSTQPYPLQRVIDRHGLGRFRVTQKANLDDPSDVYRSENARPEDWIMVGTHDTKPIWLLAKEWQASGEAKRQAEHLARRLLPRAEPREIERHATELAGDRSALVHAKYADAFMSDAENVMIFFADLFGLEEIYNRPGVVHPDNWMLRLGRDAEPMLDLRRVASLAQAGQR